jgi:ABC-2 type transport system ATP-binding protein
MDNTIELAGVSKSFGRFKAVDTLSFNVPRGIVFGLLGPNGAGKTTTIRMIMNITAPDSGEIRVLGAPMSRGPRTGSATCPRSAASTGR